jgi:hypothetical protein
LARKGVKQKFKDSQKKPKAIAHRSDKKIEADAEYKLLRIYFLIEYPVCQASIKGQCNNKSTQVHHTSISALNYLNTETWLAVCADCHTIIETKLSAEYRRATGLLQD